MVKNVRRVGGSVAMGVLVTLVSAAPAGAYSTPPGVEATPFATGFNSVDGIGPVGLAFDGAGRLYVSAGDLYRFGPGGGRADADHRVNRAPIRGQIAALAFSSSGGLYATRRLSSREGDIVQLDPNDGSIVRRVVTGLPCPTGLAVDPRSGDFFVSSVHCREQILRISGGRARTYTSGVHADGLTFAPDGTLYIAHLPDANGNTVSSVAGTGAATPGARTGIARAPEADGIAISAESGSAPFLVVNRRDGSISKVSLSDGSVTDVVKGGSRGDFVAVGPDGCLYATQTSEVVKVTGAGGSCSSSPLAPTGVRILPPAEAFVQVSGGTPGARSCRSNRSLQVRFRAPAGVRVTQARIYVKGRLARTVSGRALRRSVTLSGLPAAGFRVTIRAKTKGGRTIVVRRSYKACAGG
jgi:hypothetical protein